MLVDIPKDVFQAQGHYTPVTSIHLPGYKVFTEGHTGQIRRAAQLIWEAERPFVYAGGGIIAADASAELREFVERHRRARRQHPDGPRRPAIRSSQLHQHARHARQLRRQYGACPTADLLIALGVRFDDRVTGRLAAFAPHAKVIHVDIDPAEIGKNRTPDVPIVGDVKRVLAEAQQAPARRLPPAR